MSDRPFTPREESQSFVSIPLPDLQTVQVLCTTYTQDYPGERFRFRMIERIEAGRTSITLEVEVDKSTRLPAYGKPTVSHSTIPEDLLIDGQAAALAAAMIVVQRLLDMYRLRAA